MLALDTVCPNFELEMVPGIAFHPDDPFNSFDRINRRALPSKPLLLMVICAHCPFVKHIENCISDLYKKYCRQVQFLAVSSNSLITHPQDGPEYLASQANRLGWKFPYLLDKDQYLAKQLQAACTPDFYIFSPNSSDEQILKYRGQLDDSRPGNALPVNGKDIRLALDSLLIGREIVSEQKPSIGCNIKWNPGNEPEWFQGV